MNRPTPSLSSKDGSWERAREPESRTAGIMRAAAYMANNLYARDIRTDGVMVIIAAIKKLKAVCIVDGKVDRAWINVE